MHSFDDTTPLEETLGALNMLVQQGKVRSIGVSNYAAWQIAKADGICQRLGFEQPCSVQAYYSLVGRELEREIIPASLDLGLGILVWSPLASGFLSGKYTRESAAEGRRAIAEAHDASVAQVSLAWLLHKPGVTSVIVGARKEKQLVDNLGAADLELSADEMARLDDVSQLTREYPAWTSGSVQRGQDMATRLAQMG